jgi:hypothetical protein
MLCAEFSGEWCRDNTNLEKLPGLARIHVLLAIDEEQVVVLRLLQVQHLLQLQGGRPANDKDEMGLVAWIQVGLPPVVAGAQQLSTRGIFGAKEDTEQK